VREDLHRRALDACDRLAELYQQAAQRDAAAAALEHAVGLDPLYEEACPRLIALQHGLGRSDAHLRTYEQLKSRLADLGVEPEEETVTLVSRLHEKRRQTGLSSDEKAAHLLTIVGRQTTPATLRIPPPHAGTKQHRSAVHWRQRWSSPDALVCSRGRWLLDGASANAGR
jgi:DNA-binding SARP family transcriptional activator